MHRFGQGIIPDGGFSVAEAVIAHAKRKRRIIDLKIGIDEAVLLILLRAGKRGFIPKNRLFDMSVFPAIVAEKAKDLRCDAFIAESFAEELFGKHRLFGGMNAI